VIGTNAGIDFEGLYEGYELRSNFNGGTARVRGLELAYQQQFSMLPGFWKGFGVFANYTYVESEGNYGQAGTALTSGDLENFTPRTYNAGISYIARGATVRVKYTQRSPTLNFYSPVETLKRYVGTVKTVDLNLKYDWRPGLSFFVDVINLFDAPTSDWYIYTPSRYFRSEQFTTAVKIGVSGRF
jgi:outer membrane receptor protein involved in Fe transport